MSMITEDDLHALADGRLGPERRTEVEAWLQGQPEARAKADAWRAQNDALRVIAREVLDEPVPSRLLAALNPQRRRWAMAAAAALVAGVTGTVGWFGHAWYAGGSALAGLPGGAQSSAAAQRFARDAMVAHAVYSPEVRHAVEVAADQKHLMPWLSKRVGTPLKAPMLQAQGFELVGGRLLPGETSARAQFMYQNAAGERVTLYLSAVQKSSPVAQTALRFEQNGNISAVYWIDRELRYALSGDLPRARLMPLAELAYQQLGG